MEASPLAAVPVIGMRLSCRMEYKRGRFTDSSSLPVDLAANAVNNQVKEGALMGMPGRLRVCRIDRLRKPPLAYMEAPGCLSIEGSCGQSRVHVRKSPLYACS